MVLRGKFTDVIFASQGVPTNERKPSLKVNKNENFFFAPILNLYYYIVSYA